HVTLLPHRPGDQFFLASDGLLEEEELPDELLTLLKSPRESCTETLQACVRTLERRGTAAAADDRTAVLILWK
ncbi:SpoIIE family protein phosphatase, partial [Acinetobacter baumannii]|uniref:SpoIIE family protein phosphatase n=1 Tax=Acinetobacter baumannii TaxID=470 RepID=UPI003D6C6B3C